MKKVPKDFDISTSAKPGELKKIFSNCFLIGKRFRLAHIRFGKKIIEVATFRAGTDSSTLIIEDNIWGTSQEDVLRRDFTINGLFYDPKTEQIIDYVDWFVKPACTPVPSCLMCISKLGDSILQGQYPQKKLTGVFVCVIICSND